MQLQDLEPHSLAVCAVKNVVRRSKHWEGREQEHLGRRKEALQGGRDEVQADVAKCKECAERSHLESRVDAWNKAKGGRAVGRARTDVVGPCSRVPEEEGV